MKYKHTYDYAPPKILQSLQGLGSLPISVAKFVTTGNKIGNITMQRYSDLAWDKDGAIKNKTLANAITWARGVSPIHQPLAVEAAYKVLQLGIDFLPPLKINTRAKNWFGRYSYRYNIGKTLIRNSIEITLAETKYIYEKGGLEVIKQDCVDSHWSTQINTLLHELGHHIAIYYDNDGLNRCNKSKIYSPYSEMIKKQVSGYAATKWSEFDAELIAGILAGKKYPQEIINLCNLHGSYMTEIKKRGTIGMQGFEGIDNALEGDDIVNYSNFYDFAFNIISADWYDTAFRKVSEQIYKELYPYYNTNKGCKNLFDKYCHELSMRIKQDQKQNTNSTNKRKLAEAEAIALELELELLKQKIGLSGNGDGLTKATYLDVVKAIYTYGNVYASQIYGMRYFDFAQTPEFMKKLGLTGDKFTIRYGTISSHVKKDIAHRLPIHIWQQLPMAIQDPLIISKYYEDEHKLCQKGYRIYTQLQLPDNSYVMISAEVKLAGKGIEVNSINTIFARKTLVSPIHEDVIYKKNTTI